MVWVPSRSGCSALALARIAWKGISMEQPEPHIHSFIVKIWVTASITPEQAVSWHGYITHVPEGERHYLRTLEDIAGFIAPYIDGVSGALGMQ